MIHQPLPDHSLYAQSMCWARSQDAPDIRWGQGSEGCVVPVVSYLSGQDAAPGVSDVMFTSAAHRLETSR